MLETVSNILLLQEKKNKYLTNEVSIIFRIIENSNKIISNNNSYNANDLSLAIDNILMNNNTADTNVSPKNNNNNNQMTYNEFEGLNINISPLPAGENI